MMNQTEQVCVAEVVRSLEQTVNSYMETLGHVSLEQLLWKPAPAEWSLGQMLMHLIQSAQGMQLANVRRCLAVKGTGANADGNTQTVSGQLIDDVQVEKTAHGEALFQYGSFPPERIEVPASPYYTPLPPENKEQLVDGLTETLRQVKEIAPAVKKVREQVLARCSASYAKSEDIDSNRNQNSNIHSYSHSNISSKENSSSNLNIIHTDSTKDSHTDANPNPNADDFLKHMTAKSIDADDIPKCAHSEHKLSLPTVAHPRLGGLNAWEWFWLIEMHYRHHLHQQQRLEEAWAYEHA
ncbi:DinB family protein [Paenibacillus wenxiniae]|uniref:DinB family protein n=1 Tax=Paenibacillus wenxiniae TaxID=1636843 RepID=A0ABW4RFJ0_9BACL